MKEEKCKLVKDPRNDPEWGEAAGPSLSEEVSQRLDREYLRAEIRQLVQDKVSADLESSGGSSSNS